MIVVVIIAYLILGLFVNKHVLDGKLTDETDLAIILTWPVYILVMILWLIPKAIRWINDHI